MKKKGILAAAGVLIIGMVCIVLAFWFFRMSERNKESVPQTGPEMTEQAGSGNGETKKGQENGQKTNEDHAGQQGGLLPGNSGENHPSEAVPDRNHSSENVPDGNDPSEGEVIIMPFETGSEAGGNAEKKDGEGAAEESGKEPGKETGNEELEVELPIVPAKQN